ncbi:MAG: 4-hydroxythreonine-4-phosphate dehydrogenase PdxA [Myxococcales bacterium]|nr:MAG: 4-hydroxythreonine-4-phosphate dehydrogenase PdxA [Myxococcales bacterium]
MFLEAAIDALRNQHARALVTAPMSKEAVALSGTSFSGHTEHLAQACGLERDEVSMLFLGPNLRIGTVSTHLAIANAPKAITTGRVYRTIKHLSEALTSLCNAGKLKPPCKLYVTGLNPHAGEAGMFGTEEITAFIQPSRKQNSFPLSKTRASSCSGPLERKPHCAWLHTITTAGWSPCFTTKPLSPANSSTGQVRSMSLGDCLLSEPAWITAWLTMLQQTECSIPMACLPQQPWPSCLAKVEPMPILVQGAREHNLKNITIEIPTGKLVAFSGPSGSGKSSLAIDTIFLEAQHRYLQALGPKASALLSGNYGPKVDYVQGLPVTIALRAADYLESNNCTVGSESHIEKHLGTLTSHLGIPHCPNCDRVLSRDDLSSMVTRILALEPNLRIAVLAPLGKKSGSSLQSELESLRSAGFVRVSVDGKVHELSESFDAKPTVSYNLDLHIDRLKVDTAKKARLAEALALAVRQSGNTVRVLTENSKELFLSQRPYCESCDLTLAPITAALFSFSTQQGACPKCFGSGLSKVKGVSNAGAAPCKQCKGERLRPQALLTELMGRRYTQLRTMPLRSLRAWLHKQAFSIELPTALNILPRVIEQQLSLAETLKLTHLELARPTPKLSAGEAQRLNFLKHIGSETSGILYILDEPSKGLHPLDHRYLMQAIDALQKRGNNVIVIDHNPLTLKASDLIIDFGPGAGKRGGKIVAVGSPKELAEDAQSVTGPFLFSRLTPPPQRQKQDSKSTLRIQHAKAFNLKDIDVSIPLKRFSCVVGPSGSGKSALLTQTLAQAFFKAATPRIKGLEHIDKCILVDQKAIGRNARSTPATFSGLWDVIRELLASLPEARARGFSASRFSFNTKGGRCEHCQGQGIVGIDFDVALSAQHPCPVCSAARFNEETLSIRYRGHSASDVLDLSAEEALELFSAFPKAARLLEAMCKVGMGYVPLGQSATTLSGGEAQRLKLAKELGRAQKNHTLYLLDEPSAGLHPTDIKIVLSALQSLVEQGHTVVLVDHQAQVISEADYIIELGPGAGPEGGTVIAQGERDRFIQEPNSPTAAILREALA